MSSLDNAIQLIRQGRKEEARQILEPVLKTEPGNIQAWFWYVETLSTVDKRIQVLEVCLKMNPGNSQVIQALQTLHKQRPVQAPYASTHAQPPKPAISQPLQPPSTNSAVYNDRPKSSEAPSGPPMYFDNTPQYLPLGSSTDQQKSPGKQKNAWEQDGSNVDASMLSKPKPVGRRYAFYDAWMTVLTSMDIESYTNVIDDPEAGSGRAFEWIAYIGIISGLIFPFSILANPQFTELMAMPEVRGLFGNMGTTSLILIMALVMALLMPIFSVIGLAISAAIQNFLAVAFGGNGNYSRTVYALAAYLAPMTIIGVAMGIVPWVGQCLTSLLGIYNIILNVRALRAAHSLSTGKALMVMFIPGIIVFILGCLLVLLVGLPNMPQ